MSFSFLKYYLLCTDCVMQSCYCTSLSLNFVGTVGHYVVKTISKWLCLYVLIESKPFFPLFIFVHYSGVGSHCILVLPRPYFLFYVEKIFHFRYVILLLSFLSFARFLTYPSASSNHKKELLRVRKPDHFGRWSVRFEVWSSQSRSNFISNVVSLTYPSHPHRLSYHN